MTFKNVVIYYKHLNHSFKNTLKFLRFFKQSINVSKLEKKFRNIYQLIDISSRKAIFSFVKQVMRAL